MQTSSKTLLLRAVLIGATVVRAFSQAQAPPVAAPAGRAGGGGSGPIDKQIVDPSAAARGKTVYIAECVTCHGAKTRGIDDVGPDLVRSVVALRDRYGSEIGPFLRKGHRLQSGNPPASLTPAQIADLSHFLKTNFNETLRSGPNNQPINVLTGNPKAGAAYFEGAGKCNMCHSPGGDLAGIGKKYDPVNLQQRFLFPRPFAGRGPSGPTKPAMVTVSPATGPAVSGVLDRIDDFGVSLRDASGEYRSWKRTPDLKIEKTDPYAAHIELLDRITDPEIHNIVAYLETLK